MDKEAQMSVWEQPTLISGKATEQCLVLITEGWKNFSSSFVTVPSTTTTPTDSGKENAALYRHHHHHRRRATCPDLCSNPVCVSRPHALRVAYARCSCPKCGIPYCSPKCAYAHAWDGFHTTVQCSQNAASKAWAHNLPPPKK